MFFLRHRASGATNWTQQQFSGVDVRRINSTDKITGVTLRRNLYAHVLGTRARYTLRISSDEVVPNRGFLQDFLRADEQQYSELASPSVSSDTDGVFVVWSGGDEPVSYLNDITALPEYTINLDAKGVL